MDIADSRLFSPKGAGNAGQGGAKRSLPLGLQGLK